MSECTHHRQDVAREQIELTQKLLRSPEVSLHLGEASLRMQQLADMLYVPDVSDGTLVNKSDGIPVMALIGKERVTHISPPSTEQRQAILRMNEGRDDVLGRVTSLMKPRPFHMPPSVIGFTTAPHADIDIGPDGYELRGAPAIILHADKVRSVGYTATTLVHELVHAGQLLKRPIRPKNDYGFMKHEVQAYTIQSKILRALEGDIPAANTHMIAQAYELWRQEGRGLERRDEVVAFSKLLTSLQVPPIHPAQSRIEKD